MKTILITGANGNLGSTVTRKFLLSGHRVIATVANVSSISTMEEHANLSVHAVDLSNEEETGAFTGAVIKSYESIDAALLLAGGFASGGIGVTSGTDLRKQYSLNFETAYFTARPLFNHMMERNSGRIIFVGARPAIHAEDGKSLLAYALSKSLLFKLAELLNETARGKNVTASVIVPGVIDTAANRKNNPEANFDDWVKPERLAGLMELVCSEAGSDLREGIFKIYGNS